MVKSIFKRGKKPLRPRAIFGWTLLAVITIVMIFFGLTPDTGLFGAGGAAAEVNGSVISMAEVEQVIENQRRGRPEGQNLTERQLQMMRQNAVDLLINRKLMLDQARSEGIVISDRELLDFLVEIPVFQEDGRFSKTRYTQILETQRASGRNLEKDLRDQLLTEKVSRYFQTATSPLDLEDQRRKQISNLKVNVEFLRLPTEDLVSPAKISDSEAEALLASSDGLKAVQDYYESQKGDQFTQEEQVQVQQILIRFNPEDPASEQQAMEKAEQVVKRAQSEDFNELVQEVSEDPVTKNRQGLIGPFERGTQEPALETAAFSLEPGEVSDPVRGDMGYYVLKLKEKTPAKTRSFEEVRLQAAKAHLAREKSRAAIDQVREALRNRDSQGLTKLAQEHGLKWEETGMFSLDAERVPKVGMSDEFVRKAFQLNKEQPLSQELIHIGPQAYALRLKDRADQPGQSEASEEEQTMAFLQQFMSQRRMSESLDHWIRNLRDDARIRKNPQYQ